MINDISDRSPVLWPRFFSSTKDGLLLFVLEPKEISSHFRGESGSIHIQKSKFTCNLFYFFIFFKRLTMSCTFVKRGRESSEIALLGCWTKAH